VTRGARLVAALTAGAAVVAALAPQAAHAHGIVQRTSLPIPEWLFGWAAASAGPARSARRERSLTGRS